MCLEIRKKGKRNQNYISAINVQETASRGWDKPEECSDGWLERRSFTNLSMHCSGNLDLFLSCSTDLWTDGSSRMNASFHFFPKTWLENPKKWIKHRCLFGFFAKPAVVLEGEHNIEPDQESQTCKPDQRRNVHCSRWSFSRFSVSHGLERICLLVHRLSDQWKENLSWWRTTAGLAKNPKRHRCLT